MHNAAIPFDQKHPIILPKNCHITDLIILKEFWIISGNREIKRNIHKCVACFRAKAHCSKQLMGSLPENRVIAARPFKNNFWKRWHKDYLAQLQSKPKWRQEYPNIKENMLVLLKEDGIPCLKWPMARIIKTIAGKDGKVRVVQVQTKNGIYTRSITKLAILLIS
ncbi:hypothetical protein NQ315_016253 [Exocentrus adspersus]|uniref:DUF5641 domain-containing protein n=1 Tax=Exocentrus adspersus TaxID=1586481 RepID=A0AAV8VJ20_9CUCU|nr:hypothetical protein NQ315_016253 [Exocentrus adspersus]